MVVLGRRYKDRLTGYEGFATARAEYLDGAVKVNLERRKGDGSLEEIWWNEGRLVEVDLKDSGTGAYP